MINIIGKLKVEHIQKGKCGKLDTFLNNYPFNLQPVYDSMMSLKTMMHGQPKLIVEFIFYV